MTLTVAQTLTDTTALGEITTAYTLTISDTAAHIQALTATQIAGLGNLHVTQIAASDTSVGLSVALATALQAANIQMTALAGSTVTLGDISTNLTAMSVNLIAAWKRSAFPALSAPTARSTSASSRRSRWKALVFGSPSRAGWRIR